MVTHKIKINHVGAGCSQNKSVGACELTGPRGGKKLRVSAVILFFAPRQTQPTYPPDFHSSEIQDQTNMSETVPYPNPINYTDDSQQDFKSAKRAARMAAKAASAKLADGVVKRVKKRDRTPGLQLKKAKKIRIPKSPKSPKSLKQRKLHKKLDSSDEAEEPKTPEKSPTAKTRRVPKAPKKKKMSQSRLTEQELMEVVAGSMRTTLDLCAEVETRLASLMKNFENRQQNSTQTSTGH